MRSLQDFFQDILDFKRYISNRQGKTIHTEEYEQRSREIYSDWQQAKVSLEIILPSDIIENIDDCITSIFKESRKSRSNVSSSINYLRDIETVYYEHIYPELSSRDIEVGFVDSLISQLDDITSDKYHEYMGEAVRCIQADAYRGAIILAWQAGMYALYKSIENHDEPFHVLYQKKFSTTPDVDVNDFWSFQKLKDKDILILAESAGIIDKSLKDTLDKERDLRNKAAHPGKFNVGPNATKALLEKVTQLLITLDLQNS